MDFETDSYQEDLTFVIAKRIFARILIHCS